MNNSVNIELKPALNIDTDFAFEAKRQAMGPHISKKWGWDESFQRKLHEQRYSEKPWFIVYLGSEPIGTVSILELSDLQGLVSSTYLMNIEIKVLVARY